MNGLTKFGFKSNTIRVVQIDGEPWFVARDICVAINVYLGRSGAPNVTMLCQKLDADETQFNRIELSSNGARRVALVSESGLYKLIMRSDKPAAKPFRDWVTKVILPTIRRTAAISPGRKRSRLVRRVFRGLSPGEASGALYPILSSVLTTSLVKNVGQNRSERFRKKQLRL